MSILKRLFGPPKIEKLKTKGNVKGLVKALSYTKDVNIRRTAAQALVEMGYEQEAVEELKKIRDIRAVEPLVIILHGNNNHIGKSVVELLDQLSWQPPKNEHGAYYWIIKHSWDKCVEIGTPAVEPLISTLQDSDKDTQKAIEETLVKLGNVQVVELLITALENKEIRKAVISVLGRLQDKRAVEPLISTLKDPEPVIRDTAAWALGLIEDNRAVEPLISTLKDPEPVIRDTAAWALGLIGDNRAVEPLINTLEDESMRWQNIAALGKICDKRAVKPLIALLERLKYSSREMERMEAVLNALDNLGDSRAKEPIQNKFKDLEYHSPNDARGHSSLFSSLFITKTRVLIRLGQTQIIRTLLDDIKHANIPHQPIPSYKRTSILIDPELKDLDTKLILLKSLVSDIPSFFSKDELHEILAFPLESFDDLYGNSFKYHGKLKHAKVNRNLPEWKRYPVRIGKYLEEVTLHALISRGEKV